jgi:hypothetical protein
MGKKAKPSVFIPAALLCVPRFLPQGVAAIFQMAARFVSPPASPSISRRRSLVLAGLTARPFRFDLLQIPVAAEAASNCGDREEGNYHNECAKSDNEIAKRNAIPKT